MNIKYIFYVFIVNQIIIFSGLAMEYEKQQNTIIQNPFEELKKARNTLKEFKDHFHQKNFSSRFQAFEKFKNCVYKWEKKKNRIFLLDECSISDNDSGCDKKFCSLSRFNNPNCRKKYEEKIVAIFLKKLKENKEINYVDFGSYHMFQTLVILAGVLEQNKTAKLNIHLIDLLYKNYVKVRSIMNNGLDAVNYTDDSKDLYYIAAVQNNSPVQSHTDILFEYGSQHCRVKQFLSFLKKHYPESDIHLFVHENYKDYFSNLTKYNLNHADIISAADIDDFYGKQENGSKDYTNLCTRTLKNKSNSENIWLARSDDNDPQIKTIKLKKDIIIIESENI